MGSLMETNEQAKKLADEIEVNLADHTLFAWRTMMHEAFSGAELRLIVAALRAYSQ
jgi:hypothetical protein